MRKATALGEHIQVMAVAVAALDREVVANRGQLVVAQAVTLVMAVMVPDLAQVVVDLAVLAAVALPVWVAPTLGAVAAV